MNKLLVVVDCQNDFITGSLANPAAQKVVPNIVDKINNEIEEGDVIFVTMDTHNDNYLDTLEGKKLPIVHCLDGSEGWMINSNIQDALDNAENRGVVVKYLTKSTFGSLDLIKACREYVLDETEIEFIGFVSSICVVSNALMFKSRFLNNNVSVDSKCIAGLSEENNNAALEVMRSCQIDIIE